MRKLFSSYTQYCFLLQNSALYMGDYHFHYERSFAFLATYQDEVYAETIEYTI